MTENMPPTLEQTRQLYRSLTEKVLDKACNDDQWKQQLLDDPEAAMRSANFPETQQYEQMRQTAKAGASDEVSGQWWPGGGGGGSGGGPGGGGCPWYWQCGWYTWYWYREYYSY